MEVLEGIKYMYDYIMSLGESVSLVEALHTRFNIRISKSKCYLCLLFLLLDNKEGETVRNRCVTEWNLVSVFLSMCFK